LERYIQQVLEQFPNQVNYVIKHFPLSSHPFAQQGALAAVAAGRQGQFWAFHSQLLDNHNQVSEEKIVEIAGGLGLNMEQFNQDRSLPSSRELIAADVENGRRIGVRGTPSLFLNGKRIKNPGALPELIARELGK
jgi:protein-disulfide isomerase